ncbi:hypothetical protein MMYC01_203514 [Madurella mycetomatis]|uniref:2EXR domain-containing protein n=1 Tax=Madurella mycetomatis TaxID=100816 RepID=A0A175W736_9PEZI|nr:hypothetical protein MMYC01_203514 [Madurella mycetomatis]
MASKGPLTSFTVFSKLPLELQLAIWELVIPDPVPEVCITWPLYLERMRHDEPIQPLIVDTAWPAVTHVCRTSRRAVLKSGQLRRRYSPTAGLDVPFRMFDPAIDTLYIGRWQTDVMVRFLVRPENAPLARALRHIAIETAAAYPPSDLAEVIRKSAIFLKTLSFLIPDLSDSHRLHSFLPPAGRFRLRDIPDDVVRRISLTGVPFVDPLGLATVSLPSWMEIIHRRMDEHVINWNVQGDEGTAWSTKDKSFSGVEFKVQTFVEYTMTADEGPRWERGSRELKNQQPNFELRERKNPEEYRVLDDDREPPRTPSPKGWPDDWRL